MEKLNINQWAEEDRPREKLVRLGAEALSNAELLAILIGSGSTKESAVGLMQRVLSECQNSLNALGKQSIDDLCRYNGVGQAKAVTILAACELGKRRQRERAEERKVVMSSAHVYELMHPLMQDLPTEEFWVLLLNQACRLIKTVRIARGGISDVSVDVRLIVKEALLCNATAMAICHNHPSNNVAPSQEDNRLTERVRKACDLMRLRLTDHVIVADGQYYSYRDAGKL